MVRRHEISDIESPLTGCGGVAGFIASYTTERREWWMQLDRHPSNKTCGLLALHMDQFRVDSFQLRFIQLNVSRCLNFLVFLVSGSLTTFKQ